MRKTLQDLTIKDNFMFAAVMADPENCKELLEMVLEIPIAKINVHPEKTIIYNPTSKGVRLDIEAEDEDHAFYGRKTCSCSFPCSKSKLDREEQ